VTEPRVTLEEGAAILVDRVLAEPDREKNIAFVLEAFKSVQAVAIHEAKIVFTIGGAAALHRLFNHHGMGE